MTQLLVQLEHQTYPCEITHSKRARYLRIKLTHSGNLSVVVPTGIGEKTVKDFVSSQADWIERKLSELTSVGTEFNQPAQLNLIYLNEIWDLEYFLNSALQSVSVSVEDSFKLKCVGKVADVVLLHKVLGMWLKKKAEQVIPERLAVLAEQHGFHFNRVTIRGQKTRWGSCSTKKNINLNYKLLFLEPDLVDYVLIHELCHTIEMNHSQRFWSLVGDCDTDYKQHDKQLNRLARALPL